MSTINEAINRLKTRHKEYLQSEYHIRHDRLIQERMDMLEDSRGRTNVMADPFLEAPPKYNSHKTKFDNMNLPTEVKAILTDFAEQKFGVYNPPYEHQAEAVEAIFNDDKDVIVVTGTGSGKTEVFTYSILGKAAQEGLKTSSKQYGVRTLVLYPMNALVSDQLTRIRKMFGLQANESTGLNPQNILSKYRKHTSRPFRFAMYTGRTPYHGTYDDKRGGRNTKSIAPIMKYYDSIKDNALGKELEKLGRVPQKNLEGFWNKGKSKGKKFRTTPIDAEYLTRQEILDPANREIHGGGTPELLITNYSMLEYMLIRPIEQPIIEDTKKWLADNPSEKLLLVMDEAHLYRGSGGAEVALLLRRLMSRLGVGADRLQFILTSASFSGEAKEFAASLTHKAKENWHKQGARPISYGQKLVTGSEAIAKALADISNNLDGNSLINVTQLKPLISTLDWPNPPNLSGDKKKDREESMLYLGSNLNDWDLFRFFADEIGKNPKKLSDISMALFPKLFTENEDLVNEAVLQLGNLGTIAKLGSVDIPLLPTRLHLFFRGLPQHFVCVNHHCSVRRAENGEFLGKIYLEPRLLCDCGSRTYQLDTCRDCGTAFLHAFVDKKKYDNFIANRVQYCRTWNEDFESGGVNLHIMPIPDEFSPTSQVYHLDKLTGNLLKQPNQNTIRVLIGENHAVKQNGWNGYTFKKCPRCLTQINIGISARLKIQNLETSGEQPLSNIVSELFQSQPERTDIPEEIIRKVPNKGKKVLVFSDSRDKASRLASNLQNDVEFDSLRATFFKVLKEQFNESDKVLMSDAYFGFLWYCSNQNLRFFKGLQRSAFNSSTSDLFVDIEESSLVDDPMKDNIEHLRHFDKNREFTASMLRIFGEHVYSMYILLIGYLEPTEEVWKKIELGTKTINKDFAEVQSLVRYIMRYAANNIAIDPDLDKRTRDKARRFPEGKAKAQGLSSEINTDKSIIDKELYEVLTEKYNWSEDELATIVTKLTKGLGKNLFVKINPEHCQEDYNSSLNRFVLNPSVVYVISDTDVKSWTICDTCLQYNHVSTSNGEYCFNCKNPSIVGLEYDDLHVKTRPGFYRNEVERKFEKDNHPYAIRTEEHTAQVNNRDTYSGDVFSPAEKYELEFQDVIMSEDSSRGRDQPVDLLSCTTTMEVGIDIGGLTAVGMRTVPPRPDNYQQRSGRAGRRGSTLSTIVTYANNSPHEQHYFMNPEEIIGAQPKDPLLQIDNARLAERHINAMLFQIYYTVINKIPQENQSVFESIGLTEEFFDLENPTKYHYNNFVNWVKSLGHSSKTHQDICSLLPNKLANRLPFGGTSDWREKFVDKTITLLLSRLENEARFYTGYMRKKRSGGDSEIDRDNRLLDYLLRNSYLPSFAFPIDVCNFSILEWDRSKNGIKEKYSPSASVSQALAMYVPGKELHINKEKYQSAGIYVPFPDSMENRFAGEIDKVEYHVMVCDECNSLSTFDKTHEIYSQVDCENCGAKDRHTFPMYKPKAFAPLSNGYKSREVRDRIDQVNQRKSSVLLPLTTMMNPTDMTECLHNSKIIFKREEELFQLNTGPKSDDNGLETDQDAGWEICGLCGTCRDVLKNKNTQTHKRVYPRISYGANKFNSVTCDANDWQKLILGYNFQTDMVLLQTELNPEIINFSRIYEKDSPIENAALSAKEGLLAAIIRGRIHNLDMDDGEINGHYRILHDIDGSGKTDLEFYLFDTAPGGAGYSEQVMHSIEDVIDVAIDLMEECNCETSCHYCLRNYMNKFEHTKLNRHWGASLLRYLRDGEIPSMTSNFAVSLLETILKPNLESEEGVASVTIKVNEQNESLIDVTINTEDGVTKTFDTYVRNTLEKVNSQTGIFDIEDYTIKNDIPSIIGRFKGAF